MSRFTLIAKTVTKLGLQNVARVTLYKLCLKAGWRPRPMPAPYPGGSVYASVPEGQAADIGSAPVTISVFGWHPVTYAGPPDWHADPFQRAPRLNHDQDWVQALAGIGDGDVKNYWELSRFYWLPQFALAARNSDVQARGRIELWLDDWIASNSPFRGINWACGQEAAIRLMNLALGALILDTWRKPTPAMQWLVETHARRIAPTLSYALGQDNNHGTAEACALFIAGTWGQVWSMPGARQFARTGRKWINDRALRMIQPDGSPCQYSTTYHRANLEGFCMARLWSGRTGAWGLNAAAEARVAEGARWLHAITDPKTGDAPNLGSNDSSHLFSVPQAQYRDFRPTVALSAALFAKARPWVDYTDPRLAELGIVPGNSTWPSAASRRSDDGGFHILRRGNNLALLHYPKFRFRPCQADALHLDFWHQGTNLLRDAGTFSYNSESSVWFSGTAAHNTIEFDGRDQMPRLGRFLFGDWLLAEAVHSVDDDGVTAIAAAAYTDARGARHQRAITLTKDSLACRDMISGNFREACLRWRLAPREWGVDGDFVRSGPYSISIEIDGVPITPKLSTTIESRYYQNKASIPEISVKVNRPVNFVTKVTF